MNALPKPKERPEAYRDELNFAEFPLASLSTTIPKEQKTLEFTDEIFDKSLNKRVQRKLTITASDKYGLPTATDDEVILGLLQLSAKTDFHDRRVYFTRYELLQVLSWADTTRNYKRLEQSLNRWLGVTLYYEKAWWSKEEQCWVNEGFHMLDHVQIFDRERRQNASGKGGAASGKSSFVWNDVVFNSFKSGYIKQLDFEFFKGLESAIAKRIFRFLDKRFYQRQRLEFDLRTFSCEHIGLSKKCHNGELKRVLTSALQELEEKGFLERVPAEERFVKRARGEWNIVLTRAGKVRQVSSPLVQTLVDRGITAASAQRLVSQFDARKIEEKIEFCDWLSARNDQRVQKNKAGFLYRAITEDFALPDDYLKTKVAAKKLSNVLQLPRRVSQESKAPQPELTVERRRIDQYWNSLSAEEQGRIEAELVSQASLFHKQQYIEGQKKRGLLFQVVRQAIIDQYVREVLSQENRLPV